MVSFAEIEGNDYNLNIPRYIDSSSAEDLHDLSAHLNGGIPNRDIDDLDSYWQVFPNLRNSLFKDEREGYSQALVKGAEVKATILAHPEFKHFAEQSLNIFEQWQGDANLANINVGEFPKDIIHRISENLLQAYTGNALLDRYDLYQIIMDYWAETMQDDIYFITQDGWAAANSVRELVAKKGEKLKETPDLIINKRKFKAELIPPILIVNRFFANEKSALDEKQVAQDATTQELDAYIEEHAVENGLLEDALTDSGKVTKASVTARLKALNSSESASAENKEERDALTHTKTLFETDTKNKRAVKEAQETLDKQVLEQYPTLTEAQIKTLIVEDKWLTTLRANITAEIERVTQQLANRVKTLEERYAEPLPSLTQSVEILSANVDEHLKKMGLRW